VTDGQPGGETLVPVATGLRLRGVGGRLTGALIPGGVDQFRGRPWALVGRAGGAATRREIETYAIYGRKVVVKFRGVDTAAQAAPLEGLDILMPCKGLVDLPEGAYYIFELVGMRVRTRDGADLGVVRRVVETGGAPLLAIERSVAGRRDGEELLVPAARSICTRIDRATGTITIDPPEGLLEL
jgi:16S rRNA processing protein RimM